MAHSVWNTPCTRLVGVAIVTVTLTNKLHAWETDGNVGNIPAYSVEHTTQEASRGGTYITLITFVVHIHVLIHVLVCV